MKAHQKSEVWTSFEVIGDAGTTSYLTLEEALVHNLDLGEIIPNTESGTFLVI